MSGKIEAIAPLPLTARRNISDQCDLSDVFSFGSGGWGPLLYLTFYIIGSGKFDFFSGKSKGILKTGASGNRHVTGFIIYLPFSSRFKSLKAFKPAWFLQVS